ncbi:MAG: chemotaxis protein CheD [Pseudomonadota bacterium]|nr:chemotaxis protein CheD [Pseudomonadota bacterium]
MRQVTQGEVAVSGDPELVLTTVLGSCIAACVHDPVLKIGGMNHFLLPTSGETASARGPGANLTELRYGNHAMEVLINEMLRRGSHKDRLQVKLFGGGNVLRGMSGVGHRNADFIESYVKHENLNVVSTDLRGLHARRVQFYPATARARVLYLTATGNEDLVKRELTQARDTIAPDKGGDVELF